MYVGLHVKHTRYSCQILMKLEYFPYRFSKNTPIISFIILCPLGAELFPVDGQTHRQTDRQQTDRQTDVKKLIVAFRNFAKVSKLKES
jgi:hypothetical protein